MTEIHNSSSIEMDPADDENPMSSLVWIVMFSLLIAISIISNVFYITMIFYSRRKPSPAHIVICFFFLNNLVEYLVLVMDWFSVMNTSTPMCIIQMFLTQYTATTHSASILLLVYHVYNPMKSGNHVLKCSVSLIVLVIISALLCSPSIVLSTLDSNNICSLSMNDQNLVQQVALVFYNSVLPYWLPMTLVSMPLVKMMRLMNSTVMDKEGRVTIIVVIVTSFIVFYTPHASLTFIRNIVNMGLFDVNNHSIWIFNILNSLFLLITFFFHVFRPLASYLLDPLLELNIDVPRYEVPELKI